MKFTNTFKGVPDGAIYPTEYQPGDDCPPELMQSAAALGAVAEQEPAAAPAAKPGRKPKQ